MPKVPTEKRFEELIERELTSLLDDGLQFHSKIDGSQDNWYNKELCVAGDEFIQFLKETQKETYVALQKMYGRNTDKNILKRLDKEIKEKGLIHVLKKGFNDISCGKIKTVYFQPSSGLNVDYRKNKYFKNKFLLVRQLRYSPYNNKTIDMVIFINGLPILTIELKNQLTGQTLVDSNRQYRFDRDTKGEPLLQFQRSICHFSVDNDRVEMTTKLAGKKTSFLPFNKTLDNSETESNGFKVDYLWKEILTPTSLLDIIQNFILFTHCSEFVWCAKKKKVVENKQPILIFPRYHQLEVIRKLKSQVPKDGIGTNYLIQHSTGSGKSYSIGWLAFMLTRIFKNDKKDRLFDSVIIISDRKALDKQLQDIVKSMEKVPGVVQLINKNSEQLKQALSTGEEIIITTIQKFSVAVNRMKELKGRSFGVIVDEVHSSQGGKGTKNLNKTLSLNIEEEVEVNDDFINEEIMRSMKHRQKQEHISFFGFTGTPKPKTFEVFGTPINGTIQKGAFHTYTMRQSIGEEFTLDVLKSFTPVKKWFKLRGKGEDVEVPEKRARKKIIKWVDSNPKTISKKVKVIIDHLLAVTIKSIARKGKGMIVARSIKDTVLLFIEMNKQLRERRLENKIKCIVGFSGEIEYNGEKVTEGSLNKENGFDHKDIPTGFKDPLYRVLIVCNKFQTGFDEPLLHSMFIDKPLNGVQCVQTISRLNRKIKGKKKTFVLDFVNKVETIKESFQDFYETTILSEDTEPNMVYDILGRIKNYKLFTEQEVKDWNYILFSENRDDSQLQPTLNIVLERWEKLSQEDKYRSRTQFANYCKLYGYISMVYKFNDTELERCYNFFEYLRNKFPVDEQSGFDVSNKVDTVSLDIEIKSRQDISLELGETVFTPNKYGDKKEKDEEKYDLLSEIISGINESFGKNFGGVNKDKNIEKLLKDIATNDESKKIEIPNNTDSNKKDKLKEIYNASIINNFIDNPEVYKFFKNKDFINYIMEKLISRPELLNQLRG